MTTAASSNDMAADSLIRTITNDEIRTQVVRNYRQFVADVDPRGGIMDYLIQDGVISIETKERIMHNATRQDRCRAMLDELLGSSHRKAFFVLRRALDEHYPWIVERMDEDTCCRATRRDDETRQQVNNNLSDDFMPTPCVQEMARRLNELEEKVIRQSPTPSSSHRLAELESQLDDVTQKNTILQQQLSVANGELNVANGELNVARKQLTEVEKQLKASVEARQQLERRLRDAVANEQELREEVEDGIKREKAMQSRLEQGLQAVTVEKLPRRDVKQAVQDECMQMTSLTSDVQVSHTDTQTSAIKTDAYSPMLLSTLSQFKVAVYGLSVLNGRLYVARDRSNIIEVYDVTSLTSHQPSHPYLKLVISHVSCTQPVRPLDVATCSMTSSLYVSDAANRRVHRVDVGEGVGDVVSSWRVDGQPWGLSVTVRGTVTVCCRGGARLCEFTSTGELVRCLHLTGIIRQPVHAHELPVTDSQQRVRWVVCQQEMISSVVNRICIVNDIGSLEHVGNTLDHVTHALHVALTTDSNRSIIVVADSGDDRVLLIDTETLETVSIIKDGQILRRPHRVCASHGLLVVGLWDGRILVYHYDNN